MTMYLNNTIVLYMVLMEHASYEGYMYTTAIPLTESAV